MQIVAYGLEITRGSSSAYISWVDSCKAREDAICLMTRDAMAVASNEELRVRRVVKLEDGSIYVDAAAPALHVQWRRTWLRSEHSRDCSYQEQLALVDVISGRITVIDPENRFSPAQYLEWSKRPCLQEVTVVDGRLDTFWPSVRPARPGESAHYVVVSREDCLMLKTRSQPNRSVEVPVSLNRLLATLEIA
jgi:hypothetical protein